MMLNEAPDTVVKRRCRAAMELVDVDVRAYMCASNRLPDRSTRASQEKTLVHA